MIRRAINDSYKKLINTKEHPKAKHIENFAGEVIIKGIKKILKHNNKEPKPNKDINTVIFLCTSNLFIIVNAILSFHVFGASSDIFWEFDIFTSPD